MRDQQQTITQHLRELRKRVTYSVIAVVVTTGLAFAFHEQILTLLMEPARGFADIPNGKPVYTELTEFLSVSFKASLLVGLFAALPFILLQMILFVSPGLTPSERRWVYFLIPAVLLAFVGGAAFGYRILFPPAVDFLLSFGEDLATPLIRIGNYVNLMISLLFWMGIVFETPIVLFFLAKIGVVTPQFLAKNRRFAIVIAFVLGALITPTFDPINQTFVAIPIIVLYEVGIWLAKFGARGRSRAATELAEERQG
ncbi:MAG: twin-arginine translocase subunit TatC [Ardenticatenaceae bacterium]